MPALLDSTSASGEGGTGSENLSWTHVLGNVGATGLILVAYFGREESGEQNPEEINQITFNGVVMNSVFEANRNEFGSGLFYLVGSQVPVAGSYTVNLNFQDSPKQAEKKRGICVVFRNVRPQAPEVKTSATADGGLISTNLTTLTKNALLVGMYAQRTGNSYSQNTDLSIAVQNGATDRGSVLIAHKNIILPSNNSFSISPSNSESEGMVLASFATMPPRGGLLTSFF